MVQAINSSGAFKWRRTKSQIHYLSPTMQPTAINMWSISSSNIKSIFTPPMRSVIGDRRPTNISLGLNTALVTVLGYMSTKPESKSYALIFVLAAIAGITVDYLWYRVIHSYKGLNGGKYQVVHAIEKRLPLALYDAEWEALGRGKDKTKYWPFTHIELLVPWVFVAIYIAVLISLVPLGFGKLCG